jgi:hypothetical protein
MEPNRDIMTVGKTINEVASAFTPASEVISFLELLQKDVSYVFCETEAGSMKAKGSTFASANVADQDSSRVIESIRNELKVGFESIIHRHLGLLGWDEDDAAAVKIELEPMQLPPQTIEALLQFDAQYPNLIMPEQMLELVGLHLPPRASVGLENTEQPLEPRAPDIPGINEPSVPGLRDYEKPTFYISPGQTLLKSRYRTAGRTYITPKGMKIRSAGRIPSEMWEQYKAADQGGKVCLQAAALDQRKAAGRTGRMVKIRGCHVFVPDGVEVAAAFARQTGLSIEEAGDLEVLEQDFEKKTGWNKVLSEQWNKHGSSGIP